MSDRLTRLAPVTGLVFVVLMIAAFVVGPTQPKASSSGTHVIAFFTAHRSGERAGTIAGTLALTFFVFFVGSLYSLLRRATGPGALGVLALVGAGLFAAGLAVSASLSWALADAPSHLSPASAQALNAASYDMILPMIAGLLVFGMAMGLSVVRGGWLPVWLGWVLIALTVVAPSPAFPVAMFGTFLWCAVVSVLLVARARSAAPRSEAAYA
jgi:hypothetical protein